MKRRRHGNPCEAGDVATYESTDYATGQPITREYRRPCLRISCPICEPILCAALTPSGDHLRSHRAIIGSARVPYAKWAATLTLYPWPLNHQPRQPRVCKVETLAEQRKRHTSYKPAGYTWSIEPAHPTMRERRLNRAA